VAFAPDMAARPVQTLRRRDQRHEPVPRKSSFLLNASGEQIFPAFLQMQERRIPQRLRQRPV